MCETRRMRAVATRRRPGTEASPVVRLVTVPVPELLWERLRRVASRHGQRPEQLLHDAARRLVADEELEAAIGQRPA